MPRFHRAPIACKSPAFSPPIRLLPVTTSDSNFFQSFSTGFAQLCWTLRLARFERVACVYAIAQHRWAERGSNEKSEETPHDGRPRSVLAR